MENIFSVSERYNNVMRLFEDENVPQDEANEALMEVMDDVVSKGENGIIYLHRVQASIEAAKLEKKKIDSYIKVMENRKKRVEAAYVYALNNMKMKSIMTGRGELKLKKNPPAVIVDDVTQIDPKYTRQKIQVDIDKTAIKKAIKEGEQVAGAHLEQAVSLSY